MNSFGSPWLRFSINFPFSPSGGSLVSFSMHFSILGITFGLLEAHLLMPKSGLSHQRYPKRCHPQNKLTFQDPFGSHVLNIFWFFGVCFEASFFVDLMGPFVHGVGLYLTPFFRYVFYLFELLSLVIFATFHSETRFLQVRVHQFSHLPDMFCRPCSNSCL